MSRLVSSVFKLFLGNNGREKDIEVAQERARNARRRGRPGSRDRSLAAADSFIFLPVGDAPLDGPMRQRAHTCSSASEDMSNSSRFSGSVRQPKRHLGSARDFRSRFSAGAAEVEDGSSRESSRCVSFMDPPMEPLSPAAPPPHHTTSLPFTELSLDTPLPPPPHRSTGQSSSVSSQLPLPLRRHVRNNSLPIAPAPTEPAPPPPPTPPSHHDHHIYDSANPAPLVDPPSDPPPPPPPSHRHHRSNQYDRTQPLPSVKTPPDEYDPSLPPPPLHRTAHTQASGPMYESLCPPGGAYCELVRPQPTGSSDYCPPWDGKNRVDGALCVQDQPSFVRNNSDLCILPNGENEEGDDYAEVRDPDRLMRSLGRPLSPRDIMLSDKIGEGQFGDVHKGVLYPDSTEEALVAIKTCKQDASPEERAKFLQEAAVMRQFNHPHIIKLFGVVTQNLSTFIVMELAPLGQLRQYLLLEGQAIPRSLLLEYIRQLCSAMVHLEARNYVHRDIAARNILVVSPEKIKLSDFGLSRWLEEQDYYVASRGKLPIKWMAPESINFRRFTGAGDVWMWGVCCWEVLMRGIKPFVGIKNDEVIGKIEVGERLPLPPECPAPLFTLMNQCWQYDPADRPTFREIEQQLSLILEEEHQLQSLPTHRSNMRRTPEFLSNVVHDGDITSTPLPPLPPRSHNIPSISPPLPPSSPDPAHNSRSHPLRRRPPEEPVVPYSVTNIPGASTSSPTGSNTSLPFDETRPTFSPIPPPPILRPQRHQSPNHSNQRPTSESHYYTVPTDEELGIGISTQIPASQSHQVLRYSREASPYETAVMSPTLGMEEEEQEHKVVEDSETLELTTAVVKAVMELSNKLPLAKPIEYVDLVKNVGLELRKLLVKVDDILNDLPDSTHQEVRMAHKVLSSDMTRLVDRMRDLQKNCHSFLADDYQKQLLQAATIVAVNSRHLFDAVNNARSKATPSHGRRS